MDETVMVVLSSVLFMTGFDLLTGLLLHNNLPLACPAEFIGFMNHSNLGKRI
jgi:hypothetical protein